jgi:hypothetical protein
VFPTADLPSGDPSDAPAFAPLACPDVAGTAMTLHEKAAAFDTAARKWHLPVGQDLWYSVFLKDDLLTFDKVDMSDNVGSWTAMYSASQAFRYAATRDPEALDNLRRVVRGEHDMMRITGVRGLFSRVFLDPDLPGFPARDQLAAWYPNCDLSKQHCKRFNEVTTGEFAGWWFKNDVSKDEYAAHMFAMAVAWERVDDPEVRDRVKDIVTAVGDHLVDHGLRITDIDGQTTTFGQMGAVGFDDFPGFDAILTLSWLKLAAEVGGQKYRDFYDNCLLQKAGVQECVPDEPPQPYTAYFDQVGLDLDCLTNWNNHNMAQLAMYALLRFEEDPAVRAACRKALRDQLWDADDPRPMRVQQNTLYTFFYLVNRDPADPWPTDEARDAICTLKRFPESKAHHAVDTVTGYTEVCKDRGGDPLTDVFIPIEKASMDNYQWSRNPWEMEKEVANPKLVESPEDFLLAYWMGRAYGFITPEM